MLLQLITNRCPCCHEGHVFQNSNLFIFKKDKMNKECPVCNYNFEKEPGFYWGAMYASYALGVLECFITYFICRIAGIEMFDWFNLYIIILVLLVLSPFNFRMARLIWLYIFSAIA